MKGNIFRKMLVAGIVILFLGIVMQPVISIEIEEDCNCPEVDNSGRSICDSLLEKIYSIDLKLNDLAELLDQLEEGSLLYNIYGLYALTLLYRVSMLEGLWDLLKCEAPAEQNCNCPNVDKSERPICEILKDILLIIKDNYVYYLNVYNDGYSTGIEKGISLIFIAAYSEFYSCFLDINTKYNCPDPFAED